MLNAADKIFVASTKLKGTEIGDAICVLKYFVMFELCFDISKSHFHLSSFGEWRGSPWPGGDLLQWAMGNGVRRLLGYQRR